MNPHHQGAFNLSPADFEIFERLKIPTYLVEDAQIERVTDNEARWKYGITAATIRRATAPREREHRAEARHRRFEADRHLAPLPRLRSFGRRS